MKLAPLTFLSLILPFSLWVKFPGLPYLTFFNDSLFVGILIDFCYLSHELYCWRTFPLLGDNDCFFIILEFVDDLSGGEKVELIDIDLSPPPDLFLRHLLLWQDLYYCSSIAALFAPSLGEIDFSTKSISLQSFCKFCLRVMIRLSFEGLFLIVYRQLSL